jgi:hypothetical protein
MPIDAEKISRVVSMLSSPLAYSQQRRWQAMAHPEGDHDHQFLCWGGRKQTMQNRPR